MDYSPRIKDYLSRLAALITALDAEALNRALNLMRETAEAGGRIYVFGNGGSAATASHLANDFNKGVSEGGGPKFEVICLNDNAPLMLAIANDIGFEEVFRFQLRDRLRPGDLVMPISGSGRSPNIIRAAEYARERGIKILALTGYDGGALRPLADIALHVPIENQQLAEDVHLVFNHLMMSVFCQLSWEKQAL